MAQVWEDFIQEGSFDGVAFEFVSAKDSEGNDLDSQKLPNVNGERQVGRGRRARVIRVLAIFADDTYPEGMNALLAKLRNGGVVKKLVHPIFGEIPCAAEEWTVSHDADDAVDSGSIEITFREDNETTVGVRATNSTLPARGNEVRSLATAVFTALAAYEDALNFKNSPIGLEVTGAVNAATSIADTFEAQASEMSTLEIQSMANGGLAKCDGVITSIGDYDTVEEFDLCSAVERVAAALRQMTLGLLEARPPLSKYSVPAETNLLSLAHAMGVDAEELLAMNSFPDPSAIPVGFTVLTYGQ